MEDSKFNGRTDRTIYLDHLRVTATLAVVILHVSAQNWYTTDVDTFEWQVFNFFSSVVRWAVPVFVMISGTLFLSREIPQRKMLSKYVLRMVTSFIVWSTVYVIFCEGGITGIIQGHYHMWFILMIAGLYTCIPFIRPIAENEDKLKYYFALAFLFAFALPWVSTLSNDFGNALLIKGINAVMETVGKIDLHFVLGYTSYFVLGYYLDKIALSEKQRRIIYLLGAAGFVLTVVLDSVVALKNQQPCGNYYGNFAVNILMESIAVFTWFKYRKYDKTSLNTVMAKLSKYSFGAYLVHALILEQLADKLGLNTLSFNAIGAVLLIAAIVFVVSFVISAVLNHIPFLNKYIV